MLQRELVGSDLGELTQPEAAISSRNGQKKLSAGANRQDDLERRL